MILFPLSEFNFRAERALAPETPIPLFFWDDVALDEMLLPC